MEEKYIIGLPKAELHLHIEGTLEPELMFELAQKNQVSIDYVSVEQVRKAYLFDDLDSFLKLYYQGMAVLREESDYYALTWQYLQKCNDENIVYSEIFFDPQAHLSRGVEFHTVLNGIYQATQDAKAKLGVECRIIVSILRDQDVTGAHKVLDLALQHRDKIIGLGLDSSEKGNPPSKFESVYQRAKLAGLHLVAHAGEEGDWRYVKDALDSLQVERIDHGNRSLENKELVNRLIKEAIPLTLCPLSNLKLKVVKSLKDHPVKKMLDMGLKVTVNSDDPAYFGGYLTDNLQAIAKALPLSQQDFVVLVKNAFSAAFLNKNQKQYYLDLVDEYHTQSTNNV